MIFGGGILPRALSQTFAPQGFTLALREEHKKTLPALTNQTKPPHTKVAHLEKFQTIAIGRNRADSGRREPGSKDAPLSKVMWQPQLLGDQDGPLFGLGRRGFLLAESQPALRKKREDFAELEGKQYKRKEMPTP